MLCKQISAIVVAVWSADDGVYVEPRGFGVCEEDAGMVVIFDEHDRRMDSVVESSLVVVGAAPCKAGFV